MLINLKLSQISPKVLPASVEPPLQRRNGRSYIPKNCGISRREITRSTSLILLMGTSTLNPLFNPSPAKAEENIPENSDKNLGCRNKIPTRKAFLEISIDGEPVGRITIALFGDDVPIGTDRFSRLVSGKAGISYRRKEFVKIMPNYVQHGGIRSYGVDAERAGGGLSKTESLVSEWEDAKNKCTGLKNAAGTVGIVVRDPYRPPPKIKLIAKNGKLEINEEEVGVGPNGTEFVISVKDAPEIDNSVLVIGRVLEGMEVVERIGKVKTVQENTGSPYFRVAKLIGDKRAVVAERGFNRPYSRVLVTNCGLID